jgi:hypothetical protein
MSSRKLKYGSQDWFDTFHSEIRVPREPIFPREPIVPREPINVNMIYPQMAPCPPGYKYRPKRKPGQRKCTKETVKSVLSFLQMLATQNRISIFKPRKDKKGYTRTLLTIPQLKSRLTRHGISYKIKNISKFGMEQQNPPWRDSQEPPFYGMSEADYNEVQAMIRSRPQRPRVRLPPLTPRQLAARAERWERRAEELEERGESSEGYSEIQNGIRVALPSWREILEARRTRGVQGAIQDAMTRYLVSNPPGAGAAFGVLQPRRTISDSRNVRRNSEDALSEMENLRRRRARERMRREIAGDIIFPERPWHRAAPPYATTIQRYARGMMARNTN